MRLKTSVAIQNTLLVAGVAVAMMGGTPANAVGTWTSGISNPYDGIVQIWLLTDGRVLSSSGTGGTWEIYAPDSTGNYANGTWTQIPNSPHGLMFGPSGVFNDGSVCQAGGEYANNNDAPKHIQIYNPVTNSWTNGPDCPDWLSDTAHTITADGRLLCGWYGAPGNAVVAYNRTTNTWSEAGSTLNQQAGESEYLLLPDGSVFDPMYGSLSQGVDNPERYMPSSQSAVSAGTCPITISTYGEEGPIVLLPDGRVWCLADDNHTALYTPPAAGSIGTGSWATGVSFPSGYASGDSSAVPLLNGNVLCLPSTSGFWNNGAFYEYNPTNNSLTSVPVNPGGPWAAGGYEFLNLPTGQIMVISQGGSQIQFYNPTGSPNSAWRPTVTNVSGSGPYTLTGTQLTGVTDGAQYGDDMNPTSNYPIVTLHSGSNVYYCRTSNFSTRAPAQGSKAETCTFTTPSGLPSGTYSLYVSVNGISSATAYSFTAGSSGSAPTAPTNLTASAGNSQVALSWSASSGATSYSVYRGTTSGGESTTPIATGVTTTSYTNTGLTNGTTYYYKVKAVNSAGTSGYSNEASAKPVASGLANGTYTLTPQNATGTRLGGSSTANGAKAEILTKNITTKQKWIFTNTGSGLYKIQYAANTGICLDVVGGGTSDGTLVDIWTDNGGTNQRWSATLVSGTNVYELVPENASGESLEVPGAATNSGTQLDIWSYGGGSWQQWAIGTN